MRNYMLTGVRITGVRADGGTWAADPSLSGIK